MNSPILGLDIGATRTGVALSESGILASPLTVLESRPPHMQKVVNEILALAHQYEIRSLVIGMPYTEDGEITEQARWVYKITEQLRNTLPPEIEFFETNEFASSLEADRLFPDTPRDSAAATVILQAYLDENS
jgi:putative Holliday junction resolvase